MPSARTIGAVRAPEIDRPGIVWLNAPGPLSLAALRGRLVILDFWTFCCVNCLQIIPTLKRVEARFPAEVVVVGVHSPKFAAEKDPANVREAVRRYGILHPIAHDPGFVLWRQYGVRAWPTLVFVGPDGYVLGQTSGEPDPERFEAAVAGLVAEGRRQGAIVPAELANPVEPATSGRLAYPGKIKRLPGTPKRWVVADAGHHQVVELADDGSEIRRWGSGEAGFADGSAASFNGPQGLVADEDAIWVADTFNHAVRRIDRGGGRVETVAGTGRRGHALGEPRPARTTALASVWDLELVGERIAFCNAGTHQIGVLDPDRGTVAALAGDGGESLVDGPGASAQLAQPSGLAIDASGRTLYVADSETSAVRAIDLEPAPAVRTIVGAGLFDFGHVNGPLAEARLQHCLGIAWTPSRLLVADSYNGAIRVVDLAAKEVRDLEDPPFECEDPVCLPPGEPAGIAADGPGRLLLADTNNHRILEYRIRARRYRTWSAP
jgi:thiol-disulfide isomerase/thioredoxin